MIDVTERWPCEMMRDFSLPTAFMAISDDKQSGGVRLDWSARWDCLDGSAPPEETKQEVVIKKNRPPTVALKASPERGEPALTATFVATGSDPDGDAFRYRFRPPGGNWTGWGDSRSIQSRLARQGVHVAQVQAIDSHGALSAIAEAQVKLEDPVWDTLVLNRRKTDLWHHHVTGWGAYAWTSPTDERKKQLERGRAAAMPSEVRRGGGDLIGWVDFMFMRGPAMEMAMWLAKNHSVYVDLINKVKYRDAIVIMSRVDPNTGKREYKTGIWNEFPNKAGWPLGDTKSYGVDALRNQWQTKDNKSLKIGGQQLRVNVVGYQHSATPVILDLAGTGKPDLLAGPDAWKRGRASGLDRNVLRRFNLDTTGDAEWEWVGPTAGLLVWGGDRAGPVTAERLFGNHTWGGVGRRVSAPGGIGQGRGWHSAR